MTAPETRSPYGLVLALAVLDVLAGVLVLGLGHGLPLELVGAVLTVAGLVALGVSAFYMRRSNPARTRL